MDVRQPPNWWPHGRPMAKCRIVGLHRPVDSAAAQYPKGTPEATLGVLSAVVTVVWAVDELVRGVNPFRRILGVVVLLTTMSSIGLLAP
jgi:hypothetical protein